jgi:DNA polymerase-4
VILHVDLDAFFAAVEVLDDPSLAGLPVLVGGAGPRGVVAAASYEARRFGVHSAMPMARARRLCPQAVIRPPRFDAYSAASRAVFAIFRSVTPLVQGISVDEAFLDVTGATKLFGPPAEIGRLLRTRIRAETGLAASVGVGTNKLVAKLASEEAKPDGIYVVAPGTELAFVHPLPVRRLWGVGPATGARLARLGVETVGDVAALPQATLVNAVGRAAGTHLWQLARGEDPRRVEPERETKSVGAEETFPKDIFDGDRLAHEVRDLSEKAARRLREHHLVGRTVTLKVRFRDFTTITRSLTLPEATSGSQPVTAAALELLARVDTTPGIRLLGVSLKNLAPATVHQETLDFEGTPTQPRLDETIDALRARFGTDAIHRGSH